MHGKLILLAVIIFTFCIGSGADAQSERSAPDEKRTLELVDELKEVIRRAEGNRSPDRGTLEQLRDLVKRYDWPWRVRLLKEDFSDGDYTANPVWTVRYGKFRVTRGFGLRSDAGPDSIGRRAPPEHESGRDRGDSTSPLGGILGGILKDVLEPRTSESRFRGAVPDAEIATRLDIDNAFAIRVRMISERRNTEGSRIEFGPYRGDERDRGYRLTITSGRNSALELLRLSTGRSSVVERYEETASLDDGRVHDFEWRRDREGNMQVFLDGREVMRTVDRGVSDRFDGFIIANGGGDYTFELIEIFAASR